MVCVLFRVLFVTGLVLLWFVFVYGMRYSLVIFLIVWSGGAVCRSSGQEQVVLGARVSDHAMWECHLSRHGWKRKRCGSGEQ